MRLNGVRALWMISRLFWKATGHDRSRVPLERSIHGLNREYWKRPSYESLCCSSLWRREARRRDQSRARLQTRLEILFRLENWLFDTSDTRGAPAFSSRERASDVRNSSREIYIRQGVGGDGCVACELTRERERELLFKRARARGRRRLPLTNKRRSLSKSERPWKLSLSLETL